MNKNKTKILIVGNSLSSFSGFSKVSSSFLERFHDTGDYDVSYCTICGATSDSQFFEIWGKEFAEEFKNLECYDSQSHDEKVFDQFDKIIEHVRPQIVFIVSDIWLCESIIMSSYRNSFMLVMYTTIETPEYPEYAMFPSLYDNKLRKSLKNLYERCDLVIPVTQMGKKALEKMKVIDNVSDNVYNGLDIEKRDVSKKTKKEVFGDSISEDTFMFMCVSENSDRKILDRTIYTFKTFLDTVEDKNKYKLYLHSNFNEIKGGTDLVSLIINSDLKESILLPRNFIDNQFMPTEQLYERYAASDCCLALTGGEGMGYAVIESLMHEVPVVYIDYGGYAEFMDKFGFPAKIQTFINAKNIDVRWGLVDIEDAVKQIQFVIANKEIVKEKTEKGFKWAKENLDWDVVFSKLLKIIEEKYKEFDAPKVLLKQIM